MASRETDTLNCGRSWDGSKLDQSRRRDKWGRRIGLGKSSPHVLRSLFFRHYGGLRGETRFMKHRLFGGQSEQEHDLAQCCLPSKIFWNAILVLPPQKWSDSSYGFDPEEDLIWAKKHDLSSLFFDLRQRPGSFDSHPARRAGPGIEMQHGLCLGGVCGPTGRLLRTSSLEADKI